MNKFDNIMIEIEEFTQSLVSEIPPIDEHIKLEYYSIQNELLKIYHEYMKSYNALEYCANSNTVRVEHASGGECLHRGFYCPSPIIDKLIGNVKRGKLLKQFTPRSKKYYKYFFDNNNRLIKIEKYEDFILFEYEYVIHSDSGSISVTFNEMDKNIIYISLVKNSDNRIAFYATIQPDFATGKQRHFIHVEKYHYDKLGMCGASICWEGIPELGLLKEENYRFNRDEKGEAIGYWLGEKYYSW
jgi:hypothetical protein